VIVYFDASALVKHYVAEEGSTEVEELLAGGSLAGTSVLSRAEVSAAIARACGAGVLAEAEGAAAVRLFRRQWPSVFRIRVDEGVVARADMLAWDQGLRGYDAVHLASALAWRESLGEDPVLATFDRQLWDAARAEGLAVWPERLGD
jgi:predicted nucleic acid-binding protein